MDNPIISCCSLYFAPEPGRAIVKESIDVVSDLLAECNLSPFHCEFGSSEDDRGSNVRLHGGPREASATIAPGSDVVAVHYGSAQRTRPTDPWTAKFDYVAEWGCVFLGIESGVAPSGQYLARRFFSAIDPYVRIDYGYGFSLLQEFGPAQYALGIGYRASVNQPTEEFKRLNNLWSNEVVGNQKYLAGYLRQVYHVNVLSNSHLDWGSGSIAALGIGKLDPLDRDRWLWLVPESSIPEASAYLIKHGRLLCV